MTKNSSNKSSNSFLWKLVMAEWSQIFVVLLFGKLFQFFYCIYTVADLGMSTLLPTTFQNGTLCASEKYRLGAPYRA